MKRNQKPGLYVGRRIQFSVADGYAEYDVVEIRPARGNFDGECVVDLVPDMCGYEYDGAYVKPSTGDLVIPLPVVQNNIKWADQRPYFVRPGINELLES